MIATASQALSDASVSGPVGECIGTLAAFNCADDVLDPLINASFARADSAMAGGRGRAEALAAVVHALRWGCHRWRGCCVHLPSHSPPPAPEPALSLCLLSAVRRQQGSSAAGLRARARDGAGELDRVGAWTSGCPACWMICATPSPCIPVTRASARPAFRWWAQF